MDILLDLNSQFQTLVVEPLDAKTREVIVNKVDISKRPDIEKKRMRKAVLHQVYGKQYLLYTNYLLHEYIRDITLQ